MWWLFVAACVCCLSILVDGCIIVLILWERNLTYNQNNIHIGSSDTLGRVIEYTIIHCRGIQYVMFSNIPFLSYVITTNYISTIIKLNMWPNWCDYHVLHSYNYNYLLWLQLQLFTSQHPPGGALRSLDHSWSFSWAFKAVFLVCWTPDYKCI